ncbi:hypothetical protein [Streptomyces griseoaurantiacus]|uniref:hypothetical protein n=1 Tax=Streptomyces griseoaurantiacus TaxID=68213 RepID=UPI001786E191
MRKALPVTTAALLLAGAVACSSNTSDSTASGKSDSPAKRPANASSAFSHIAAEVSSAKLSGTVTAANDPNHLLGRPNQYTSKVTFTDARIKAADVSGTEKGAVERGGAIEVFANSSAAQARAKYIQAVTKSMSALAEYDYVHGAVLVRVSHFLTPDQAAAYKSAANGIG